MLFAEDPLTWAGWTIDIVGSDVSESAVRRAREGSYSQFEVQRGLGVTQMIRWFEENGDQWQAAQQLRSQVRFAVHNLLDPPIGGQQQYDVILCRNVLLYLSPEKRTLAFERLASALAPDGALMLGAGETVIGQTERFAADRTNRGFYRLTGHEQSDRRVA